MRTLPEQGSHIGVLVIRSDHRDEHDQPPICPRCGVTMVPAALSADQRDDEDWVCLECEELGELQL